MKTIYIERSSGQGRDGDWVEKLDLEGVDRIVVGTGPGSFAGIRSAIAFAQGYALGRNCKVLGLPSPCAVAAKVFTAMGTVPTHPMGTVPTNPFTAMGTVPTNPTGSVPTNPTGSVPTRLAVVGDARCGKLWIAVFDGFRLENDVFQVDRDKIVDTIDGLEGKPCLVVTADEQRIGSFLAEAFADRRIGGQTPRDGWGQTPDEGGQTPGIGGQTPQYIGGQTPDAEGLRIFAEANPAILQPEPLPIYLNPAVR